MEKVETVRMGKWRFSTKRVQEAHFMITMARGAKEDAKAVLFTIEKGGDILLQWGVDALTGEVFRCDTCRADAETVAEMETYLRYEIKECMKEMSEGKVLMAVGSNFRIPREVMHD